MIVDNRRINRICSFYVSEFHLEMILVPFIISRIEKNEKIIINTEYNLENTMKVLLSRINLSEYYKNEIIKLDWNKKDNVKIYDNCNNIIIGNRNYIKNINDEIMEKNLTNVLVVDCYRLEEVKDDIDELTSIYDSNLNTENINSVKKMKNS